MKRAHVARTALSLGVLMSLLAVWPAAGSHTWSDYCSSGWGLLWVFEDENFGGQQDHDCNNDPEWGDAAGQIRNFHDKMTSFHASDHPGDGTKLCVRFYENANTSGASTVASGGPIANGVEYQDPNIGGTWNDRVDSHSIYGTTGGSC
jgi:hypothetical protein